MEEEMPRGAGGVGGAGAGGCGCGKSGRRSEPLQERLTRTRTVWRRRVGEVSSAWRSSRRRVRPPSSRMRSSFSAAMERFMMVRSRFSRISSLGRSCSRRRMSRMAPLSPITCRFPLLAARLATTLVSSTITLS
jgi:hypothetical protein